MKEKEFNLRNSKRDIWCVRDSKGNIICTSEVPKGRVTPEQILANLQEAYPDEDLEVFNISAEEHDEHENKIAETKGKRVHHADIVKRVPEVVAERKKGKIARKVVDKG